MFYRIKDNTIYDYAQHKYALDCLETNIVTTAQLDEDKSLVIIQDGVLVLNPDYDTEQATKREENFKTNFFEIAPIEGLFTGGWYRRVPKGYTSAIESLNTAFNAVTVLGKLPADTLTFYTAPDFADAEQCTEEWLVANAFKNAEMTTTEFGAFYATFLQAWNATEH